MELDGLEGNEDFWNMDLSDDEVPIRVTTTKHGGKSVRSYVLDYLPATPVAFKADTIKERQGTAAAFRGLNADRQVEEERSLSRSERLPNGKYRYWCLILLQTLLLHTIRCNHPCKDKSICGHLWCGSLRPPTC